MKKPVLVALLVGFLVGGLVGGLIVAGWGQPDVAGKYKYSSTPTGSKEPSHESWLVLNTDGTFTWTGRLPRSPKKVESGTYKISDIGIEPPPAKGSVYLYVNKRNVYVERLTIVGKDLSSQQLEGLLIKQ